MEYRNAEKKSKAESTQKAEQLFDVLSLVGENENQFIAGKMHHTITDKGFYFEAIYYIQILPVVLEKKMERLEYNDKKLVGYK